MISFNPIFFQPNSISKLPTENSTKLFKNSKYLFADLIKVSETEIAEESDFPETLFRMSQNSDEQSSGKINFPGFVNSDVVELNANYNTLSSSLFDLEDDPIAGNQIDYLPKQNEIPTTQIKDVDKKVLKKILTGLMNITNVVLPGIQNPKPEIIITSDGKTKHFTLSQNQQLNDLQIEKIIDLLGNGVTVELKISDNPAGKLQKELEEFVRQTVNDNKELIVSKESKVPKEIEIPERKTKKEIHVLFNSLSGNDEEVKFEINLSGDDSKIEQNSSIEQKVLINSGKVNNSGTLVREDKPGQVIATENNFPEAVGNSYSRENNISITIKIVSEKAGDQVKNFPPPQFVTKDALKNVLRHNHNLKQLSAKVSNIFRNPEPVVEKNDQPEETIVKNKQENSPKVFSPEKGKIKFSGQELTKPGNDEKIEVKETIPKNSNISKESNVELTGSRTEEPIAKINVDNQKTNADQINADSKKTETKNPLITQQNNTKPLVEQDVKIEMNFTSQKEKSLEDSFQLTENNPDKSNEIKQNLVSKNITVENKTNTNNPVISKVNVEKIIVEQKVDHEQSVKVPEEKIKITYPERIKLNLNQAIETNQAKLDNIKLTTDVVDETTKAGLNKPDIESNGVSKKNNSDQYLTPDEKINLDESSGTKLNTKETKITEQLNKEKTLFHTELKVKSPVPELVKQNPLEIVGIKTEEPEKFIVSESNNIEIKKSEITRQFEAKVNENRQPQFNHSLEVEEKIVKHEPVIDKTRPTDTHEPKQIVFDKAETNPVDNKKVSNPEVVKLNSDVKVELKHQETGNTKPTTENKTEINKPEVKQIFPKNPEKVDLTSIENIDHNDIEVNQSQNKSDAEFNEQPNPQKENEFVLGQVKQKSESNSIQPDKKITTVVNDLAGVKEIIPDKSITGNFIQTKVENVLLQPEILNRTEVFNKVSELIQTRDKKSIEIKLDPPEFGKMNIRIDHEQNKIYVNIEVKDENVRGMIFHNLDQLRQSINQNGLQLQDFFVSLNGEEPKQFKSSNKNKRNFAEKTNSVTEKMDTELSSKMMGYNTYDFLI